MTAFFQLCKQDEYVRTLLYCDVPKYYTWNKATKIFSRRSHGISVAGFRAVKSSDALGLVYTVHPNDYECYFLKLSLHVVKGSTSFNDLKLVNGHICKTYQEACQRRGLLKVDLHWDETMKEADIRSSPEKKSDSYLLFYSAFVVFLTQEICDKVI